MGEVSSPQCDRPRVDQLNAGHRRDRKLALSSSSWTSTAPVGVSGVRGHNRNRFFDSLINFQVYARADNSSITIGCFGAVSDCGKLIKTTRLAVPSLPLMLCRKPQLGKDPLAWSRLGGKAARWRSRRLRQLGKSSQPIETKWADLAPVGKIVA